MAQGDAQHVNFLSLACQFDPQRSVVDLGLFTGFAFHAPDALWIGLPEFRYEVGVELGLKGFHLNLPFDLPPIYGHVERKYYCSVLYTKDKHSAMSISPCHRSEQ